MRLAGDLSQVESYPRTPVELRVTADFHQLPVVRAVAETLALLSEFNLDEVADIKLAVDELCSQLITGAATGSELRVVFLFEGTTLRIIVTAQVIGGYSLEAEGWGWHVLGAVTDGVVVSATPPESLGASRQLVVELSKARRAE